MDKYIYGADTETLHGRPMTLQFYSEHCACDEIHFVNEKNAAATFFKWCKRRRPGVLHVVYIHNLAFDLVELLWGYHPMLAGPGGDFEFEAHGFKLRGVYGTPTFCTITDANRRIMLVDSFSYFRGSLAKGAELFCPDLPKLKRVDGLGERPFKPSDSAFVDYAMRDAVVSFHMGCAIERMHQEYDLQQCVSVADMASRIFRHRFLTYDIPQPNRNIVDAALKSYHGGKNNVTVPAGWYEGVNSLDISSAYPHAMRGMPAFSDGRLYRRYAARRGVREVPPYGVYCISGTTENCQWPVIFSHGFEPLRGDVENVWVQGFEVNEALASGELKLRKMHGFYYDAERDHQAPALRGFVDTFYALKEAETDPVLRYMQKLVLNSISGKFIQTRKSESATFTDADTGETKTAAHLVAGGMFHPFIASAITAHTRARIHQLEHKYKAIHTATDGIMTQHKSAKASGKGLGALTMEAKDATLLLLRNKCYVLYTDKGAKTTPSAVFKGKHIRKYALHGFQGNVTELEKLVSTGRRKYTVNRPYRLKEALKKKVTPNEFVRRDYVLKVGELRVR